MKGHMKRHPVPTCIVHCLLSCCRPAALLAAITGAAILAEAQTLIYREGFNDDGETNVPPRYTTTGRDVYEVPRIQSELSNYEQAGPIYFAHNFNVSYVGNPAIPARRAIWTPRGVDTAAYTEDLLGLWDSMVDWLLQGKTNATIVVTGTGASGNGEVIQGLSDRMRSRGHTVVDDDPTTYPDAKDEPGDLFIHATAPLNASRFILVNKPVIVMNDPDYDDMLVGSIGSAVTFTPGQVTIAAPGHPAAGGRTGSFDGFTADQAFGVIGSFLPTNAITLATVTRTVPPGINNLLDLDAVIAGTKQHDQTSGTATDLDFFDGSSGSWFVDNGIPGGYAGNWGLRIQGKLSVGTAGTYRFALGSDDGARLQIDLDRNGITSADTVLEDPGPHGHQVVYADVTFAAAGDYDYEVRAYNSGAGGDVEVSVSNVAVPVPDDALDSGFWELLSTSGTAAVKLQAAANVTAYVATGADVQVQTPIAILLNGPADSPAGTFFDGGPFSGQEGTGYFAGSGLNKFAGPTTRTLTLQPVNVAGRSNVKLTIALAATVVDFETSDLIDIVVYTNGLASNPTTLAHFQGVVNAIQPWMADQRDNFVRRLTRQFADFTYNIPAGATDLVVEVRMATTWWTEIAAFDNIRITEGAATVPTIGVANQAGNVVLTFSGTLQSSGTANGTYQDVPGNPVGTYTVPSPGPGPRQFYRSRN